jgi:hypothetical protein
MEPHPDASVQEIRDVLLDEYDVDIERCERDLIDLLKQARGAPRCRCNG